MNDFLVPFSLFLMAISCIAFLFGLLRLIFNKDDKKFSLQILIYSAIALIIGFSTCLVSIQ